MIFYYYKFYDYPYVTFFTKLIFNFEYYPGPIHKLCIFLIIVYMKFFNINLDYFDWFQLIMFNKFKIYKFKIFMSK